MYTEWETTDDDGNDVVIVIPNEVELRNPFDYDERAYNERAVHADFSLKHEDFVKLKQFCFAKGIFENAPTIMAADVAESEVQ